MSAYSDRDLGEAFRCAERGDFSNSIEGIEGRVLAHLRSSCTCDLRRCDDCGLRPTNNVPRHKPGCKLGGGKR